METPQLFESLIRVGSSGSSPQYLELSKVYFTCCSVYYITGEFIPQCWPNPSFWDGGTSSIIGIEVVTTILPELQIWRCYHAATRLDLTLSNPLCIPFEPFKWGD
ncbi:hypothetical protein ANOM_004318 [Aspergillus nomiae NRRL 13137]|uniref:Uncharacterized protein n=1 Tax=Aspergillus nomiae NRRL (strain ATCC 15546 / NRRL 13137 / CBS 260.88 / M93) TaxID=1509407 RepID=A0A0L1J9H6_ASPN3|nr:uncharacterized protein ANOM_004318 [Aspergillus nomiae NRRL 13137]KNG88404.1 hypothetical protein ANOM_004318 [Aspergillus nomiae NRRL 13137]